MTDDNRAMTEAAETDGGKKPGIVRAQWNDLTSSTARKWSLTKKFTRELFNDHGFWVEALAVKGGASAIVIAGLVTASYVIALPFLAAAAGIAVCTGLVGVGIYGIAAGSTKGWESLKGIWARSTGKAPAKREYVERKDFFQRLKERQRVQKMLQHPVAQKVFNSRAWQITEKFTQRREDSILGSIAVGGAALTLAMGAIALSTQLLILPVVAAGTLLTFSVVTAATTLASGCSGLFFSIMGIRDRSKQKAEMLAEAKRAAAEALKNAPEPIGHPILLLPAPIAAQKPLAESFDAVAIPGAINDNKDAASLEKPKQNPPKPAA